MIEITQKLQSYLDKSYGYVIFPKVTKVGLILGGAGVKEMVYKGNSSVGESSLKQVTIGLQAGGQHLNYKLKD